MHEKDLAVLVVSCDKYCDVWSPFFDLFFKFWPDCPYKIYLGTNELDFQYQDNRVNVIKVGPDISWASNYRIMLDSITEEYVLSFLDDYLLSKKVETERIQDFFKIVKAYSISCFRLNPKPSGTISFQDYADIKLIQPSDRYCINAQVSIWNKKILSTFLIDNYNPWEFEVLNSRRCNEDSILPGTFVVLSKPIFYIKNGIDKGKWVRSSLKYFEKQNMNINTNLRPKQTFKEALLLNLKYNIGSRLPTKAKTNIKEILIKLGMKNFFNSEIYDNDN